jgi:hypothetical protein
MTPVLKRVRTSVLEIAYEQAAPKTAFRSSSCTGFRTILAPTTV